MESIAAPGVVFTALIFFIVIGILVFVHEFGHYGMGRLLGMKIEAFAVGFGKEVLGWTDRHGTRWKLGWIPLGGYAKFAGDMNAASQPNTELADRVSAADRAVMFQLRPLWQRAAVVAAGPLINFLFAILIFFVFFMTYGHQITPPVVGQAIAGMPAAEAGVKAGDRIVEIDGRPVERFEDVLRTVSINTGTPIELALERDGQRLVKSVTPNLVEEEDRFGNRYTRAVLGLASGEVVVVQHGPLDSLRWALIETRDTIVMMWDTLAQIVTGRRAVDELGGPIKIAQF
ncbi:MAG: M50 family metallopeptidase, partial [Sphingomonadaceae bacterium]